MNMTFSRLSTLWYRVSTSFWFRPTLLVLAALAASPVTLEIDSRYGQDLAQKVFFLYVGDVQGARSLLSTITASLITVISVTFSVTVVTLTVATSQFGPRLLNSFMNDRSNQVVLGLFIAIFTYALTIVRAVREGHPVPHISVTLVIMMAVISIFTLIFFIHHVASSIKADTVIHLVEHDLISNIRRICPEPYDVSDHARRQAETESFAAAFHEGSAKALANDDGYVQALDTMDILSLAEKHDLLIRVNIRPGDYVVKRTPVADVFPRHDLEPGLEKQINSCILLGGQRTPRQDLEYALNQLVEIALRALSPGINDTFTALTCIDRLSSSLAILSRRRMPSPLLRSDQGALRVQTKAFTFDGALDAAFAMIRQNSRNNTAIHVRLLQALSALTHTTSGREQHEAILRHARLVMETAERELPDESDRRDVRDRLERIQEQLSPGIPG